MWFSLILLGADGLAFSYFLDAICPLRKKDVNL